MRSFAETFSRKNVKKVFTNDKANKVYSSLFCIMCGLLIGFILMVILSPQDAIFDFGMLISGGLKFYGVWGFGNIIANFAPLLCCGVGIIFAYKTGMFNIGAPGQFTLGAFGALMMAIKFHSHWTLCMLVAILFGALWAVIPALLKVFCHVNEVISGIMLNWVGLFFVNWSMQTYLSDMLDAGSGYRTKVIRDVSPGSVLPNFGLDTSVIGNAFSCAFIFAIAVAIIAYIIMEKTTFGYQLKASGYNRHATKYAGINAKKNAIITLIISGAIIGLGASLYYLAGVEEWSGTVSTALPQIGWNGIIIAFISQMSPLGAIFASLFLSFISIGASATTQSVFPKEFADLITSIIVYLSGLAAITLKIIPWIKEKIAKKKGKKEEQPLIATSAKEGK